MKNAVINMQNNTLGGGQTPSTESVFLWCNSALHEVIGQVLKFAGTTPVGARHSKVTYSILRQQCPTIVLLRLPR